VAEGGGDIVGRVESWVHDARDPEIERVTDPDSFGRLDTHQDGHVVRGPSEDLSDQRFLSAGAVFEVDEQPVKATERTHFGDQDGAEIEERAERYVAVAHALVEGRHRATSYIRGKFVMR
jgi:hypothetical protein